ncbi:MAG TPA: hypothetical protein VFJ83_07550 [Nocardioidaceae bacterium]|nr:hypothetical protein [Nocardioidaceae bacterium]
MDGFLASVVGLLAVALLGLAVLTALGSMRRGARLSAAALSGLFFPVAWVLWYLRDVHPYAGRRSSAATGAPDASAFASPEPREPIRSPARGKQDRRP